MATVSMKRFILLKVPQLQHRRKVSCFNFNFYLMFFVFAACQPH